jgi:hypothetical protein
MDIYNFLPYLKDKKIIIDDVFLSYSDKIHSHRSAYARIIKNQLDFLGLNTKIAVKNDNLNDYDCFFILLPPEFQKTYNLFLGAEDGNAERLERILNFKGKIFSINKKLVDIGDFVRKRYNASTDKWKKLNVEELSNISNNTQHINLILDSNVFVLGDSHSNSVYIPGSNISRNDGKTLYGILKEGFESYIPNNTKHLISYFGNIDIRHHLCRQENPVESTLMLVNNYINSLKKLNVDKLSVVQLLPIEYEQRKLSKTGYYKGTPFFGSLKERKKLMELFNSKLEELALVNNIKIIKWPKIWYEMDPKEFADTYMEKPYSVHLSPEYYQYDLLTSQKNNKLNIKINSQLF